jgi:hypothetical protein
VCLITTLSVAPGVVGIVVLPVVSTAVLLSVGSSLVTIGFGSSEQLLSRELSFRHDGDGGSGEKSEKKHKGTEQNEW